jgi:uncharacterized protein
MRFDRKLIRDSDVKLTWDEAKRQKTLQERELDFVDSTIVFAGEHFDLIDDKHDYGELRYLTFGFLNERVVTIVWTPRNDSRRIISMRYVHAEELEKRKRNLD